MPSTDSNGGIGPRSRLWWYRRMRRAYRNHGVTIKNRRETWADAMYARRNMDYAKQQALGPLRSDSRGV